MRRRWDRTIAPQRRTALKASGLLACGLILGCAPPKELVYVNAEEIQPILRPPVAPSPLPKFKPVQIGAKALPAKGGIAASSAKLGERERLEQKLRLESNQAILRLAERLNSLYEAEYDQFYDAELAQLAPEFSAMRERSRSEIEREFERAAKARAPILLRLSVISEFPLPKSIPVTPSDATPIQARRLAEIQELRRKLLEIDRSYQQAMERLETELQDAMGSRTELFTQRLSAKQRELEARALSEARAQIRRANSSISGRALAPQTIELPSLPARSYAPGKVTLPPPNLGVASSRSVPVAKIPLSEQVRIWCDLRGYELSPDGPGVRDATEEFLEWKREFESGP